MDKSAQERQVLRATAQMPLFEEVIGAKNARIELASSQSIAAAQLLALEALFSQTFPSFLLHCGWLFECLRGSAEQDPGSLLRLTC
jgi:hypothetical protein